MRWNHFAAVSLLVNQRRIVVAAARLVDAPGHRPHANAIVCRLENFRPAAPVSQGPKSAFVEQHRHAIVNGSRQGVGIRDDDRARHHALAGLEP
jgi:hypothetical protein